MTEENISYEFRLKEIEEKRNYFIEKIKQNELINKKQKKVCKILNTIEVLISKALIDSHISQDEPILINNVLKEYDKMKEKI